MTVLNARRTGPASYAVTSEDLARAAPAGLARLAIPRWRTERFHAYLSAKLVDVSAGRIKRLILAVPPRHGKSTLCSHVYPAWHLGNYPAQRIILCGYEAKFAASWGRKARDILEEHGPRLFGVSVSQGSSSASSWDTAIERDGVMRAAGGGMATAGVGGPILGKGAHVFIVDDPIKNAAEARSAVKRQSQKDWFQSTAFTRLEADPEGAMIIIMQRWHEDDLAGWQLQEALNDEDQGEQWELIEFPAIATDHDALGRKPGEALSARYPIERLNRLKRKLGTYWFTALYQQKPTPADGSIFKSQWFTYEGSIGEDGKKIVAPAQYDMIVQVWDTAMKEGEMNDYSACATVGYIKATGKAYLLNMFRDKLDMPKLLVAMKSQANRWQPTVILVEDKGSGTSAVQTLRKETKLPILAQGVRGDKVTRASMVTPYIEQGRLIICKFALLMEFEAELFAFPLGTHDDMVDALVYALMRIFSGSFRGAKEH